jgi:serum/glucocorticoid-regulated kinase 2
MLTGLPPFYCEDQGVMLDLIRHARPKIPGYIGEECKSFLLKTLAKKPNDRLGNKGAEEVKNHDWFKDIDWILVLNRGLEMETPLVNQK